ncbi:MAG: hypothetical protein JXB00_18975 [Bacteroidales bacterium]|nr:hypothetical protein [Bacteroidales bacterium]
MKEGPSLALRMTNTQLRMTTAHLSLSLCHADEGSISKNLIKHERKPCTAFINI